VIDHIGVQVRDCERIRAFYERALAPLGYEVVMAFARVAGFGVHGELSGQRLTSPRPSKLQPPREP
jgi:catechol 2,3-dioxygenase-like lactoylglutathione lyase family enzyme